MHLIETIPWPGLRGTLEIAVIAMVLYYALLFFQGTRGAQVFSGFVVVLLVLVGLTYFLQLDTLTWLFERFSVYLAVAVLIIFQPEIRRMLAEVGRQHFFAAASERDVIDALVEGMVSLAEQKIGALVAVEREGRAEGVEESGTALDAQITPELIGSIFFPHTPLHDGGVIVRGDRVAAAGCLFPLSHREGLAKQLGTRHRAAIGMSEETDAVVIVVSEETGTLSVAFKGRLRRGLDEAHLRRILRSILRRGRPGTGRASLFQRLRRLAVPSALRPAAHPEQKAGDHAA
jgi:diadenylate cyclase